MAIWHSYPWTNFNELNLDWILRIIKELNVDVIPKLDEKIDNVYDYIRENLPEIVAQLANVIIDVTTVGATGDGVTDDSTAIEQALTMGSILYFPEGTYKFKDIDTNKPVYIFGDGDKTVWSPIRYSDLSNQFNNMITFKDSVFLSDIQVKPDEPLATETGTKYYNVGAIRADKADHVHLERITIDRVFEAYHTGWSNPVYVPFEEREGMAITIHSCNNVCLNDCHVVDFAGEELIWICQDRENFTRGTVKITNCLFEKSSYGTGSVAGILGSNILFTDNIFNNFNALYDDTPTSAGSIINLLGCNTICNDNAFYNCRGGNYVDFSEGFFTKSEHVKCSGNIFKGEMHSAIRCFSVSLDFSDNYIEAPQIVGIFGTTIPFNYTAGDGVHTLMPYCADPNTVYTDFDTYSFRNNKVIVTKPVYTLSLATYSAPFYFQYYSGGDFEVEKFVFIGNEVNYNSDAVAYNVIYLNEKTGLAEIKDNIFNGAGIGNPSFTHEGRIMRGIVSGRTGCDLLIVTGNIINGSEYDETLEGISLVLGASAFRTATNYNLTFNSGLGHVLDHSGLVSSLADFHSAYNDNIIANS